MSRRFFAKVMKNDKIFTLIHAKITPGQAKNKITNIEYITDTSEDTDLPERQLHFQLMISEEPTNNKANKELIKYLADDIFDIDQADIKVLRGKESRNKIIRVDGLTQLQAFEKVEQFCYIYNSDIKDY
ncbi:UNKNOWN [Stylonychia lemnae]|uniref:Uncharacterized protein n=1 Tax=Stylonychia lemnae TaxID=5949 RepID=A0A077ZYD9_STYLE|nr:UNKNOWN [Stylonychia lemnae]|eukprot:CDW74946.1 UNKNOWN [Stylonychia lemnae]